MISRLSSNQAAGDSFKMMKLATKRVRKKIPKLKTTHNSTKMTMVAKVPPMSTNPTSQMRTTRAAGKMTTIVRTARPKVGKPCTKRRLKMTRRPLKEDSKPTKIEGEMDALLEAEEDEKSLSLAIIVTNSNLKA